MKQTPLKRGKRKSSVKIPPEVRRAVMRRTEGMCVTGCGRKAVHLHHVFPKDDVHWPELAAEADNLVPVCVLCHGRHELAFQRLTRRHVRHAVRLATTPAMEDYLARYYVPALSERQATP
jgi:5-methylcytosine-specific restriction endonuclease McrA